MYRMSKYLQVINQANKTRNKICSSLLSKKTHDFIITRRAALSVSVSHCLGPAGHGNEVHRKGPWRLVLSLTSHPPPRFCLSCPSWILVHTCKHLSLYRQPSFPLPSPSHLKKKILGHSSALGLDTPVSAQVGSAREIHLS